LIYSVHLMRTWVRVNSLLLLLLLTLKLPICFFFLVGVLKLVQRRFKPRLELDGKLLAPDLEAPAEQGGITLIID
jgi:hypothetical protein